MIARIKRTHPLSLNKKYREKFYREKEKPREEYYQGKKLNPPHLGNLIDILA